MKKRSLRFLEIVNLSFGFLGIQMGFALQNANASRILQNFGADTHQLSWFWLVAPISGLIIHPIVGYYSDKTWTSLGRRRPFIFGGAILASIGLLFMPQADLLKGIASMLWVGAGMLAIMDGAINVSMQPFRALVADQTPKSQHALGYSIQTVLIGIGAVIGSWLPYLLEEWLKIGGESTSGVSNAVIFSFVTGSVILIVTVLITVFTTKEYSPTELAAFEGEQEDEIEESSILNIFRDFAKMPKTMRQLSWVQFFSWFGLFGMWVYTHSAIAEHIYGLTVDDINNVKNLIGVKKELYEDAGNWVGILFGVYNLVSIPVAFFLPKISNSIGKKNTHFIALLIAGMSMIGIYFTPSKELLILPMIGVGIAWASILSMPYAILAGAIPLKKMGVYMGIFNFFVVLPQIVNGIIGGPMIKYMFFGKPVWILVLAGIFFVFAGVLTLKIKENIEGVNNFEKD